MEQNSDNWLVFTVVISSILCGGGGIYRRVMYKEDMYKLKEEKGKKNKISGYLYNKNIRRQKGQPVSFFVQLLKLTTSPHLLFYLQFPIF